MTERLLWSPLRIGPVTVANRIVFSAHLTNYAEDGRPSEQHAAYYADRAKGGAGLIITEEHSTHPTDWPYEKLIHGFKPAVLAGWLDRVLVPGVAYRLDDAGGAPTPLVTLRRMLVEAEDSADFLPHRQIARRPDVAAPFGEQQVDFGRPAPDALDLDEVSDRLLIVLGQVFEIELAGDH